MNKAQQKYYEKNKELVKIKATSYNKNNSEKRKQTVSKYNKSSKRKSQNREYDLRKYYGLTLEEYNKKLLEQNCKCLICSTHVTELDRSLAVDHNHSTGNIRGLLCYSCNLGLGNFKDNPELLLKAVEYLNDFDI